MKLKKLYTALILTFFLAATPLWPAGIAAADEPVGLEMETGRRVVLTLGSKEAVLNGAPYELEMQPVVKNDTTFLPLRFVAEEIIGAAVNFNEADRTIDIIKGDTSVRLNLDTGQAVVNNEPVEISQPPFLEQGRTLVPLRFMAENLAMTIVFNPADKSITIEEIITEPKPVNLPPVVTSLGLQSEEIRIGEVPQYNYTYMNEEWESITTQEWSWQLAGETRTTIGKPRAFFIPGDYLLHLRIQDASGQWSETASARFMVSDEVLVSEMEFKFSQPIYGEIFENAAGVNFNLYEPVAQAFFERSGPELHLSNSPEVVTQPGVLYRSEAEGDFRFMYHHLNGTPEKQWMYIIVENNGFEPVTLKTLKSGVGGPVNDYMTLGQTSSMRYLSSQPAASMTIAPGKKIILNSGMRHLNFREAVTGMYDLHTNGPVTISAVMGPEKAPEPVTTPDPVLVPETTNEQTGTLPEEEQASEPQLNAVDQSNQQVTITIAPDGEETTTAGNGAETVSQSGITVEPPLPVKTAEELLQEKINYLLSLPARARQTQQIRGVFHSGDCLVEVRADGKQIEKITLGKEDPGFDAWMEGIDPINGDQVKSFGNYGVVYRIKVTAPVKTGILFNPRGSIFKGAFQGPDGKIYKAPETSHFSGLNRAAVLGVLEAGQTAEFIYTPPSGSDTPIVLALIPEKFWK